MIKPPKKNQSKEGVRAIIEALAQFTPPTAALSRLYQTTFPSDAEKKREEWETEVSTQLNAKLGGRLKTFGRVDFIDGRYSFGRSANVSSLTDQNVGCLSVNLATQITDDYIVTVQADYGVDARVTQKSDLKFSIEISGDGKPVDSGFVFIVESCDAGT
jgi:hypothetical protein